MYVPLISPIIAVVKNWQQKKKLKNGLGAEYRELVCASAMSVFEGNFDDAVLDMRKHYEALGLSEKIKGRTYDAAAERRSCDHSDFNSSVDVFFGYELFIKDSSPLISFMKTLDVTLHQVRL